MISSKHDPALLASKEVFTILNILSDVASFQVNYQKDSQQWSIGFTEYILCNFSFTL